MFSGFFLYVILAKLSASLICTGHCHISRAPQHVFEGVHTILNLLWTLLPCLPPWLNILFAALICVSMYCAQHVHSI